MPAEKPAQRTLVNWGALETASLGGQSYRALVLVNPDGVLPGELNARGFTHLTRYAVVPGLENPRWFIPLDSGRVSAASFMMYSPLKPAATVKKQIARSMARLGLPGWYRDQVWVAQREMGPMHRMLGQCVGLQNPILSISAGTPGKLRKPTIGVFDGAGSLKAVAKLSRNAAPQSLIRNEATMLRALESAPGLDSRVPRLLVEKTVGEDRVLLQSTLSGRVPDAGISDAHTEFLDLLCSGVDVPACELEPFVSLPSSIDATTGRLHATLVRVWKSVNDAFSDIVLPTTIVHGDFAPWNLRLVQSHIAAFDWEYGYEAGLPLFDEIHHVIQSGYLLKDWTIEDTNEALMVLQQKNSLGISTRVFTAIQTVCVAFMLLKQHWSGEEDTQFLWSLLESSLSHLENIDA